MNIVVLDGYTVNPGDNPFDSLRRFGTVTIYDRTPLGSIVERAVQAEIVLTNKTPLFADTLQQLPKLRFIGELATGFDNIDIAAAGKRGIPVSNVPGYSTDSVAQHAVALLLELTNKVGEHAEEVRRGYWSSSPDFSFWRGSITELAGKKLGIVGFGRIGEGVGWIAHAMGMEILAYNPHRTHLPTSFPVQWQGLVELFQEADVVSLHCPLTSENREFVNRELLERMKRTAFLINTARGALIQEGDLAAALNKGDIAGAAVDVVSREPISPENPLLGAKNCIITPHLAWASLEARRRLMEMAVRNVAAFMEGKPVNVVNGQYLRSAP